ncbi:hypothetical protein JTE90_009314 [Oedothorax gibbosus]|uniref:Ionotropic receptor n=1 Tax=Oedothorax gibbosus TaxID=931172 RepID=A0AAV6TLU8_9ARAC|nr:hypothetical protein JTE90_009314 [Oedothorax gibbosus]
MYFPEKIRLVTVNWTNAFLFNSSKEFSYPEFRVLDYLSKRLKFNYDVTIERKIDAILSGFKEKFDIGIGSFIMYPLNFDFAHFTVPHHSNTMRFMCEKATDAPKFNAFLYPFNTEVWIVCLCFTLAATVASKYVTSSKQPYVNIFLNLVGSIVKQPLKVENNTSKKTVWWATWLVWVGVISSLYNALFLTFLTDPISLHSPKNFQELLNAVQNKKFKSFCDKQFVERIMLQSKEEHIRLLGEIIAKNEWYLTNNEQPIISYTECTMGEELTLKFSTHLPPKVKHFSDDYVYMVHHVIYVRKSFCCFEQLNKAVLDMVEGGFVKKFYSDSFRDAIWTNEIRTLEWPDDTTLALSMDNMKYPFYLLLLCYTLCVLVFLFEIILPKTIVLKMLSNKSVFK